MSYTACSLGASTWDLFAELVERNTCRPLPRPPSRHITSGMSPPSSGNSKSQRKLNPFDP